MSEDDNTTRADRVAPSDLFQQAGDAYHARQFPETLRLCNVLIAQDDTSENVPLALYWKAQALDEMGQHGRARELWDDVAQRADADLIDPLLSLKAAQAKLMSMAAAGHELDKTLIKRVGDELERRLAAPQALELEAGLWDVAYTQMSVAFDDWSLAEVVRLSNAWVDSPHQPPAGAVGDRDVRVRFFGMLSAMMLGEGGRIQERLDEVIASGEVGLRIAVGWEGTLRRASRPTPELLVGAAAIQASILDGLDRSSEAQDVLQRAIDEFGGLEEPAAQQSVANAKTLLSELAE